MVIQRLVQKNSILNPKYSVPDSGANIFHKFRPLQYRRYVYFEMIHQFTNSVFGNNVKPLTDSKNL